MTVISKPSLTAKKTPLIDGSRCDEEVVDIQLPPALVPRPSRRPISNRRYRGAVMFMGVISVLLLLMGVIMALQIYEQVMRDSQRRNSYRGFCSVPLSRDISMMEERKAPVRWLSTDKIGGDDPDVQVITLLEEPDQLFNLLREVLDINLDDSVEKISVFNNGHPVTFLHDFDANVSGIVDSVRCFAMELDPEVVLQPGALAARLRRGEPFDVSRVRRDLRAALPASPAAAARSAQLRAACDDVGKPTYTLHRSDDTTVRKRSVDAPPHDYMQFAGKRVQEIDISNLAELLEYEQKLKLQD